MLIIINIICFLLALFTPLGLVAALAGLGIGILKGYWWLLFWSVVGFVLQIVVRGLSASKKNE